MKDKKEYRIVEKLENDKWVEIKFKDLKLGDHFRMFEPDREPVDNGNIHKATSNPYPTNPEGVLGIETERKET